MAIATLIVFNVSEMIKAKVNEATQEEQQQQQNEMQLSLVKSNKV
jgi:hypothetical protein